MQLKLKNIGMIKEADIVIDGLTVIAGENDTGKSTVGKSLFLSVKTAQKYQEIEKIKFINKMESLLFKDSIPNGSIFIDEKCLIQPSGNDIIRYMDPSIRTDILDVSMVETPVVWNLAEYFNAIEMIKTEASFFDQDYQIPYPYLMWDIYRKLSLPKNENIKLKDKKVFLNQIKTIIDGEFTKDDFGNFIFLKEGKKIPIVNTATGIKQFGIIQKLIENNYVHDKSILILDEPEVHLHPKWQLKMAEVIIELIKNGVKVVVNSHSPYMIEALQRYSELEKVNADFYLAEDGVIGKVDDSNSKTLSKIFSKLSEPFDLFEEMESERFQNG